MLQELSVAPMLQCLVPRWRLLFSSTLGNSGNHCALNISKAIIHTANMTFPLALAKKEHMKEIHEPVVSQCEIAPEAESLCRT